jgi:alkylglycerol monooxygenase
LTKPLNSWNPLWANLHVWRDLCRDAWLAPRWVDKLRIWFMPQGWRPAGLSSEPTASELSRSTVISYDTRLPRGLNAYAFVNFVAGLLLAIGLLALGSRLDRGELMVLVILVLWALLNVGGIFDHRRWAFPSELVRLPVTAAVLSSRLAGGSALSEGQLALAIIAGLLMIWLILYRRQFDSTPQARSRVTAPQAPH